MPIIDKNMKYNPWVKEESNLTKEQWDTQQKWVQGFSHSKWLNCEQTDSMYLMVDAKGPPIARMPSQSERQEMSRPSKWNYDVADSSE